MEGMFGDNADGYTWLALEIRPQSVIALFVTPEFPLLLRSGRLFGWLQTTQNSGIRQSPVLNKLLVRRRLVPMINQEC